MRAFRVISSFVTARHLAFWMLAALAVVPSWAAAQSGDCEAIAAKAETEQAHMRPVQTFRVIGKERLHFHKAPDASCVTKTYVVTGDALLGYGEWNGWTSVQYTHPKTGAVHSGWVRADRIDVTGSMGLVADDPAPALGRTGLPVDVTAFVERVEMCDHFAGEFNGDQSEHDREVNATMTELRCNALDADRASLRKKYRADQNVREALAQEP